LAVVGLYPDAGGGVLDDVAGEPLVMGGELDFHGRVERVLFGEAQQCGT
jgi:hypothetical protein